MYQFSLNAILSHFGTLPASIGVTIEILDASTIIALGIAKARMSSNWVASSR